MIITVRHSLEEVQEFELNKFPVIVGRGSDCDIVINSDNISRKHLEIQSSDEKVFIRDMTLSNWVSYNNNKLPKGEYTQYYDFAPLVLPSGHELSFQLSKNEKLKIKESDKKSTTIVDLYGNKLKRTDKKVRHTQMEKESKAPLILASVFLLIVASYIAFDFYSEDGNKPTIETKENPRVLDSSKFTPDRNLIIKMLNSRKCGAQVIRPLCDSVLPGWDKGEGVVEYKKNIFIFKNFDKRLINLFGDLTKVSELQLSRKPLFHIIGAQRVVVSNFLKALNARSIKSVYIVIFQNDTETRSVLSTFQVHTKVYQKFTQQDYINAFELVTTKGDLSVFNTKLSVHLEEKEELK